MGNLFAGLCRKHEVFVVGLDEDFKGVEALLFLRRETFKVLIKELETSDFGKCI